MMEQQHQQPAAQPLSPHSDSLPPPSMAPDLSETPPWIMMDGLLPPLSDDDDVFPPLFDDDDDGLSEIQPPAPGPVLPYSADLAAAGFDGSRTLSIGDLQPWMDEDYFINVCNHALEVVSVKVIRNTQTRLPEYAFIQFDSTRSADWFLCVFIRKPMPNSKQLFNLKWSTLVPDGCYTYDLTENFPLKFLYYLRHALLNIVTIRVKDFGPVNTPANVYGTVIAGIDPTERKVYDRSHYDPESLYADDDLTLTGPIDDVHGDIEFGIHVMLKVDEYEIANGWIHWGSQYALDEGPRDLYLEEIVSGEYGNVIVGYSVQEDALVAIVEVLLITVDGGESSSANVFGTIRAMQRIGESEVRIRLFEKFQDEGVLVYSNRAIPLSRSTVVMPSHGLSIEVELWDDETGRKIADGVESFEVVTGTRTKGIGSGYGEVQVSVTCF